MEGKFVAHFDCKNDLEIPKCPFHKNFNNHFNQFLAEFDSLGATWTCILGNGIVRCNVTSVRVMELKCIYGNSEQTSQACFI